ncbi:uncharacterized protein BO95DRAFT_447897 [Aspergillus brunneoviolaceus CBS 621.78]|uniref:Uncharacterized protein n=1 Tax=Aspergillus brunneoviolaceus CBS 621.78 TaxID=1450534 RepID=A0ACD1FTX7_9EURO|nr:hypothetical protein BO95DRAFT_447897 [Aspergillus brunneoviolaceus CBS 621.78]RAH40432.1 hypothetical protein BO95DRAFT_447897 [Aspergillus brunneoviolaceus CBS 621.78]
MSGPGEERSNWRGGRPYEQNRHAAQRHSSSRTMSAHGSSRGGPNTWNDSSREQPPPPAAAAAAPSGPRQEQHVPVQNFNATESKAALRRGPGEPRPFFYKPQSKDTNNNRASGPWGAKPNQMANGKDFFLELRKQVTALRQGNPVAGG